MAKKSISLFLSVVMVFIPFMVNAQETISEEIAQAIAQAEADAESDINTLLWIGAGCFFSFLGVGAAYLIAPNPKVTRLLGKSPEYVATYTEAYKKKGKSLQGRCALLGCVLGLPIAILSFLLTLRIEQETD